MVYGLWVCAASSRRSSITTPKRLQKYDSRDIFFVVAGRVRISRDPSPSFRRLSWSPDGSLLVITGSNGSVDIYDSYGFPVYSVFRYTTLHFPDNSLSQLEPRTSQTRVWMCITHILPLPQKGHDFHKATVNQQMFQIPGCQMKNMDTVFSQIPFGILVWSQNICKSKHLKYSSSLQ